MKPLFLLSLLALTLSPSAAIAQNWQEWHQDNPTYAEFEAQKIKGDRICLDKKFMLAGNQEWKTEIVLDRPRRVELKFTADAYKQILLITEEADNKDSDEPLSIGADAPLLGFTTEQEYLHQSDAPIPAGRYFLYVQHSGESSQEVHIQCNFLS